MRQLIFLVFALCSLQIFGQINTDKISQELDNIAASRKGMMETLRIDVEGLTLQELIATIGEEHELNFSVSNDLDQVVGSNFYDVVVKDVLLFLVQRYQLDVQFINGIIVFEKKKPQEKKEIPPPPKVIDVSYNDKNQFLSIKLKNDSLPAVAKAIIDATNKNIVLSPDIKDKKISSYIINRPYEQVLEMMAKSNGLILTKDEHDFYYLEKDNTPVVEKSKPSPRRPRNSSSSSRQATNPGEIKISLDEAGFINIKAIDASCMQIIDQISEELHINYYMYDTPAESIKTTIVANGISFDDLLENMFRGKEYTFNKEGEYYFIGKHKTDGLIETKLIQLENRSIETVLETLPQTLLEDIEIKEFVDLNGFVVTGSKTQIKAFKDFVREIDVVVPVIQIEVMIVQYQKGYDINTGLQLGIDQQERTTTGTFLPSSDVSLNSESVNSLIDSFNGLGFINLGKVTKNFYANLRAMESNSMVKITSTPKLVTLNGHEANSSIGETSYYFEQNNTLINSGISDNILQSGTFKPTEANLSVKITPVVSKDEHVTLSVEVERSSFLGRAGENAPPDKATQRFGSSIRVKNNEMVLLGGLEELEKENSGTGAPVLSRIPIIKWFFSNRTKRKDKSKLHIFIKPTVIY
ncbi:type II and III secretion system protein [Dokdonia sp.]|uniref:type II secretion system protein GspD n=1 Tax=Dokdonia sp. TaxID=2024995 RepID=UPI0032676F29